MNERLHLAEAADQLRRQFGSDAILRGHDLWLRKKLSAGDGGGDSLPGPGKN
jgi:hypothetical protein